MDKAPDFELSDATGKKVRLSSLWKEEPLLIVFYPGDFTPVCTAQLCEYRDKYEEFRDLKIKMVGISHDSAEKHAEFEKAYSIPFPLLSDPDNRVVKAYGCTSKLSFGLLPSRAIAIVNRQGEIVWRKVEAVAVTRQKADDLKSAVGKLRGESRL